MDIELNGNNNNNNNQLNEAGVRQAWQRDTVKPHIYMLLHGKVELLDAYGKVKVKGKGNV